MKKSAFLFFSLFLSSLFAFVVTGQEPVKVKRLSSPITFDGYPYEAAWSDIPMFEMTQNQPNFGEQPSEQSEIMIAYDDQYLWVGARLFMQDATKIVATSKQRDEMSRSSD